MKPTMLVIGDSFMTQDDSYPGQHWSEMLLEYHVVNLARAGASMSWIADQLVHGLKSNPSVAVVGLTEITRLQFIADDNSIYSSCHSKWMTSDEKLLYNLWVSTVPQKFKYISACAHISFIFETLRKRNIPFVWHPLLFDPCGQDDNLINFVFDDYQHCKLTQDIWGHDHKDRPKFHIDDLKWQTQFANNVRTLLTNTK